MQNHLVKGAKTCLLGLYLAPPQITFAFVFFVMVSFTV